MQKILILGAGRSASSLIKYAIENSASLNWQLSIGDYTLELAQSKAKGHENIRAFTFDVNDELQCEREVGNADLIISMLPARFHHLVAKHCVILKRIWLPHLMFQLKCRHWMKKQRKPGLFY